jgi:hypothetical protein
MPVSLFSRSGATSRTAFGRESVLAGVIGAAVVGLAGSRPGHGDSVQGIARGLTLMKDIFVVCWLSAVYPLHARITILNAFRPTLFE